MFARLAALVGPSWQARGARAHRRVRQRCGRAGGGYFHAVLLDQKQGQRIGLAMVRPLAHRNGAAVRDARSIGGGARLIVTF